MYFISTECRNVTYSIDMLRLKSTMTFNEFSEIEFRFKSIWSNYVKNYYNSFNYTDFKYNYVIEIEEGKSFWFGFCHNTESNSVSDCARYNFTIEFNPNKLKENGIILYILNRVGDWVIKSYDIAMDIPINILDLCGFDKGRKHEIKTISSGFDNKTIYMGKSNNSVKIYNKKIESNLDIKNELTRCEVRIQPDFEVRKIAHYMANDIILPELFTNEYYYSFKDYEDKTLLAILYAVQSGFEISMLSRAYKKKIKNLLEGGHKIKFETREIITVLKRTIMFYFSKNAYIRFI